MAMVAKDPDNKGTYSYNLFQLKKEIKALKESYKESMDKAEIKTVLFGDRFPFRYLMDECGISYYAAFSGCSAETEASFKTIAFLSEQIDELGLPAVLVIDGSDRRLAEHRNALCNTVAGRVFVCSEDYA